MGAKRYPLAELAVGGSFFIPDKTVRSFAPYVSLTGKRLGRKFITRTATMMEQIDGWTDCERDSQYAVHGVNVTRIK